MVLPFLCLLAFGTAEVTLAWVTNNRVEGAVAQAARIGASSGARAEADRDILLALQASLPGGELSRLDRVIVYRPVDDAGSLPAGCVKAHGNQSDVGAMGCNSYSGDTVRTVSPSSTSGFNGSPGAKDGYWPPAQRNDSLIDPPDYLGVWIRTSHVGLTGWGFDELTVTESSVFRIQPDLSG